MKTRSVAVLWLLFYTLGTRFSEGTETWVATWKQGQDLLRVSSKIMFKFKKTGYRCKSQTERMNDLLTITWLLWRIIQERGNHSKSTVPLWNHIRETSSRDIQILAVGCSELKEAFKCLSQNLRTHMHKIHLMLWSNQSGMYNWSKSFIKQYLPCTVHTDTFCSAVLFLLWLNTHSINVTTVTIKLYNSVHSQCDTTITTT